MDEFCLSVVEMDSSITLKHLRCLRKTQQYYWQEVCNPGFTNAKAFILGVNGVRWSAYLLQGERSCLTYLVLNGLWWFSLGTVILEGWGLFVRLVRMYEIYYPLPLSIDNGLSPVPRSPPSLSRKGCDYPDA